MADQTGAHRSTGSQPVLRAVVILLTLGTAVTHFTLLFPDPVFILNGLGYLALLAALYLPIPALEPHRRTIRWLLIGYTGLTLALWIAFGERSTIGYLNKLNEIALIVALLAEQRAEASAGR